MKTYTYKDLIESYKYYVLYKDSGDFFDYYIQKYLALSKAFAINFNRTFKNERKKEDLRQWFVKSVIATNKSANPFSGLIEAPDYISHIYHEFDKDFIKAEEVLHKAHFRFQCYLFELVYGAIDKSISSEELLKNGFDDTQNEPDLTDLW